MFLVSLAIALSRLTDFSKKKLLRHKVSFQPKTTISNERFRKTSNKYIPAGNYMFKVNNRKTRKRCEICSKFFIVNFEHISQLFLVFLLLTLSR